MNRSHESSDAGATRTIELPDRLVSRVEDRLDRTDFETPEAYIGFVLEEVLLAVEADTEDSDDDLVGEEVENRLKSLGYLES